MTGAQTGFALILLFIEFLDEFIYGAREAAWPLVRTDLGLSYAQIGLLLGLPKLVSGLVEPFLGVLGDVWKRRVLVLGGGVVFALALGIVGTSRGFGMLLIGFVLLSPASGAFVSLSQASLMDVDPGRRERNMVRWTFAGSIGVVLGPLALGAGQAFDLDWRAVFIIAAVAAITAVAVGTRFSFGPSQSGAHQEQSVLGGMRTAFGAMRRAAVLRWLVLLQFSDLMLDILLGYLALYFVDVAGASTLQASVAVATLTGVGLVGNFVLLYLLDHIGGLRYLRVTAALELVCWVAFLMVAPYSAKLIVVALLGFLSAGWYSVLKARLYETLPGQSGTVIAVNNLFGLVGAVLPWGLGVVAKHLGLQTAMWLLCLGPLALLLGLPGPMCGSGIRRKLH